MQRSKRKAGKGALELLSGADSDDFEEAPARAPKAMKSDKVEKVRVWWPPTKDKDRTGFSGAYWPASVHRKGTNFLEVEYDNGEREKVDPDNIFPFDVPIEFGKETTPLMVGEFVEVSNNSKTDPCAWVGCVKTLGKKCLINYPFHDSPDELIKLEHLRRARVWDDLDWQYIDVGQRWKAGEVTSPIELNLLTEEEYYRKLKQLGGKVSGGKGSRGKKPAAAAAAAAAPPSESEGSDSQQEDSSSGEEQQQPQPKKQSSTGRQRGRPRKPQHPTRSMLDEASNGTRERKEEKPTGARKRKPAAVRQA
ncbi:hypothetical protein OEZ85_011128 [Tetradesmus obliquus]|uniref:Agenet domain-containing protein n=1 Tax=Tetradesmus obliquus TaxID=3088 RepID=A0ABY8TPI2_TETOB|nr:hypothetical protein OEZ85_011128 [Tetradesmus obliquus]